MIRRDSARLHRNPRRVSRTNYQPPRKSAKSVLSRRVAHAQTGLGVRSERDVCGCVRCAADSRRAAAAKSGIIGLTIRDSSCCHWMAVGISRMRGRRSAAKPYAGSAAKCVRLRQRGCDAFGHFVHSASVWRFWPVAIRWLESDLRSGKRREYRPNIPAPALRRVIAVAWGLARSRLSR